jgi:hypothetical protein
LKLGISARTLYTADKALPHFILDELKSLTMCNVLNLVWTAKTKDCDILILLALCCPVSTALAKFSSSDIAADDSDSELDEEPLDDDCLKLEG